MSTPAHGRFDVFRDAAVLPQPAGDISAELAETAGPTDAPDGLAPQVFPSDAEHATEEEPSTHTPGAGVVALRHEVAVAANQVSFLIAAEGGRAERHVADSLALIDSRLLAGHCADGVTACVVGFAAQAPAEEIDPADRNAQRGEISVARARRSPESIAAMIELAQQTPFQIMVGEAGAEGGALAILLEELREYIDEGAKGLVSCIHYSEADLAILAQARGRRKRKELEESATTRQAELARAFGFNLTGRKPVFTTGDTRARRKQAMKDCRGQINALDRHVREAQRALGLGVDGMTDMLERDLRLAAVEFVHESEGRTAMGAHPIDAARQAGGFAEASSAVLSRLAGASQGTRADRRSETPDQAMARKVVAALTLEVARAKAVADRQPAGPARTATERLVAQKLALLVAYEGDVNRELFGRDAAMARYGQTLIGAAAQQSNAAADAQPHGEFFAFHRPGYSDASLAQDLAIAKTVLAILGPRNPDLATEYMAYVIRTVDKAVRGSDQAAGVQSDDADYDSALSPQRRSLMQGADYEAIARDSVARMAAAGGATRLHDTLTAGFADDMTGAQLAREQDIAGAYEVARLALETRIGRERQAADFPGHNRVLLYYGDGRPEDGAPGGGAIQLALSGLVAHVDSCGSSRNPMRDAFFRTALEQQGGKLGLNLSVLKPLESLPPAGRQWRFAEWHGRLPASLQASHILDRILPGGFATLAIEPNPTLAQDIMLATDPARRTKAAKVSGPYDGTTYDGEFSVWRLPTQPVRFLPGNGAHAEITFGHADPNWRWPENTLVVFRHLPDGNGNFRSSKLFAHVRREVLQLVRG